MNIPYISKVIAAFLTGVVLALGGALMYVRVSEAAHPQPVSAVQEGPAPLSPVAAQNAPDPGSQTEAASEQDRPPTPAPIHKSSVSLQKTTPKPHITKTPAPLKTTAPPRRPAAKPVLQIAQNRTAAPPADVARQADTAPEAAPTLVDTVTDSPHDAAPQETPPQQQPQDLQDTPPAQPPARQPMTVTLQSGTGVVVRLGETLSTDHNYSGDTFRATLESPIIRNGYIIAEKGSKVLGRIARLNKAQPMGSASELLLTLTEINTTDGQRIKIATTAWDKKGASSAGEDTAKIAGGAALGAIIGAMAGGGKGAAIGAGAGGAVGAGAALASHGKQAVLPVETRLTFHLAAPVTITERLNF